MSCSRTTTQWRHWGLNPRPLGLESSTLLLSHCAPHVVFVVKHLLKKLSWNVTSEIILERSYTNMRLVVSFYALQPIKISQDQTPPRSAVDHVSAYRCESDCKSSGREFALGQVQYIRGDWSWYELYGHSSPFH